ncbi:DUF4192 domain-containing protein [Cellulomonas sp. URHD0024]|uniref:DUF4192 domain-containing protein n=1 Tax=Cellulomonas sp. URHD0024 TaxID=1302620 RepID=UPI0003F94AA9|nr:DUF4192 domain-containing protein [Cellulomonas sp. URHD0024]
MEITTVRMTEARELLALVPHRLGFRPRDSAVAISLRAPRGRVGLVVRVDLPHLADPQEGPALARRLLAYLGRDDAERGVLVLYTDDDPRRDVGPAQRAAQCFRDAAEPSLGDVPVWVVTSSGYLSLDCVDDCCPPGGRPLLDLDSTQIGAQLVLAGSAVADSREDIARIRSAGAERRRTVARARRRWESHREEALVGGPLTLASWRVDSVMAWREVVRRMSMPDGPGTRVPWGRLEAGLDDRRVRDAILVALVPGTGDLPERSVAGDAEDVESALGAAMARIIDPAHAVTPPEPATAVHEAALEGVVAHGRVGVQAPALTLLALLSWWRGDGARARVLLDGALDAESGYRLAALLDDALGAAVPPGWVRRSG